MTFKRKAISDLARASQGAWARSGRKNLLVTGSINMGKTSLIDHMLAGREDFSQIRTWVDEDHEKIFLYDSIRDEAWVIGRRQGRRMVEAEDFFSRMGPDLLKGHLDSPDKVFVMDEISRLEKGKEEYLDLLEEIFEKKIVIAAFRRDDTALYSRPGFFKDCLVIDLDTLNSL